MTCQPSAKKSGRAGARHWVGVLVLAGICTPVAFAQTAATSADPTAPPVATDAAPSTPPETPAKPPVVTFKDGQLTIVAENSIFRDVLEAVREKTNADLDIPAEGGNERVFVSLGPGTARHVLDAFLAGSSFNYVMSGSPEDPTVLAKIVLFAKPAADKSGVQDALSRPTRARSPFVRQSVEEQAAQSNDSDSSVADSSIPTPAPTPVVAAAKTDAPAAPADNNVATKPDTVAATETASNNQPVQARTPNIRSMQEVLQDLYDRRRQAMEQQNPPPAQQSQSQ